MERCEMKTFILGLDGLEYNLVRDLDLSSLKQQQYGSLKVPLNERLKLPLSPEVWASFLAGKEIRREFSRHDPLEPLFKLLRLLRQHINLSLGLARSIDRIRRIAPFTLSRLTKFPDLETNSFLDVRDSKIINVPFYNYDGKAFEILRYLGAERISLERAVELIDNIYRWRKERILEATTEVAEDLVFAFMHFPDVPQHLLFTRPSKIKEYYFDLDRFVYEVKNRVEGFLLIVSDHGFNFESGEHSGHGFYSSNIALNPKPIGITDFFSILEDRST